MREALQVSEAEEEGVGGVGCVQATQSFWTTLISQYKVQMQSNVSGQLQFRAQPGRLGRSPIFLAYPSQNKTVSAGSPNTEKIS